MDKFIERNNNKNSFLCWKNSGVRSLCDIFDICVQFNKILVVFTPKVKEYSDDLKYMIITEPIQNELQNLGLNNGLVILDSNLFTHYSHSQ